MDHAGDPLIGLVHFEERRHGIDLEQIVEARLRHLAQQSRHAFPVRRHGHLRRTFRQAGGNPLREKPELFLRKTTWVH
jgi:hypothetical protein